MNPSEASTVERAKPGLLGSIGGRLYLAFGVIILLTVITTALSLYSFNRFGAVVQCTTTQTIPLVVEAKHLAERSLSLAASAQSIAMTRDKSELQATMADLHALLLEINEAMGTLKGRSNPDVLSDIREDIGALAMILEALKGLAEQRFTMRQQHDTFFDKVNKVGADFTDTFHPVTYGVHSLMGLFANRAGRRTTNMIERLGKDVHRRAIGMMAARQLIESLKAPALQAVGGEDRMPALRRSFLTIITDDLKGLAQDTAHPELTELVRMATELRDGASVGDDDLERFARRLDEQAEREKHALFKDHRRVGLETRQTIVRLSNTAVNEGGVSVEIRALGSHVISLLNTVAVLESAEAVYEMRVARELTVPFADGTLHLVLATKYPVFDACGHPVGVGTINTDITARKHAEDELRRQRDMLDVTLSSIGDAVIATDTHSRITFLNRVAEGLTGWAQQDALGRPLDEIFRIVHEQTPQPVDNPVTRVLRKGTIVGLANHTALITRQNRMIPIADSGAPIRSSSGLLQGVVLVFRDITEQKQLEDVLLRARKIESVGVLAGGIAHDFNNLLTGIMGNVSLAKMLVGQEAQVVAPLTEAENACRRATALTHQLLTFSKGGVPVRQTVSIAELLTESATFALRGSNVRGVFTIAEDLWPADVDADQINQVLQNVVLNAAQAMPDGGTVHVQAGNVWLNAGEVPPL